MSIDRSATARSLFLNYLVPSLLFFIGWLISRRLGFLNFRINWNLWQLLDRSLLDSDPLQSILLLHAQPPVLNLLLAVIQKIAHEMSMDPVSISQGLFILLGLICSLALYRMVNEVTQSSGPAIISLILFSFNPATWYFINLFFYPFLLIVLFTLLGYLITLLYSCKGEKTTRYLILIFILVIMISYTRSLYTPLWGIGLVGIIFYSLLYQKSEESRSKIRTYSILAGVFLLIILFWPIKNKILFNQYTSSSWIGYNLSRGTDVPTKEIDQFYNTGAISEEVTAKLKQFQKKWNFSEPNVLTQKDKSTGGRNWNHYLFLVYNPELKKASMIYRVTNPLHWLKQSLYHYLTWTLPSYQRSYDLLFLGPSNLRYQQYANLISSSIFFDLRPLLSNIEPADIEWPHVIRINKEVPYTVFGLVIFPLLLAGSVIITYRALKNNETFGYLYLIYLYNILWVVIIPCLTDGYEGNRMRYAIFPFLITFSLVGLKLVWSWIQTQFNKANLP